MIDDDYRPAVKVKRGCSGLGLFAEEVIPRGQLIIEYVGDRIDDAEAERRCGRYLFEVTDDLYIDGKARSNLARYVNHACRPNADSEHDESDDRIYFRAKKKIPVGAEITIDYGEDYLERIIGGVENCRCETCTTRRSPSK